jgi:hypothetical protein
VPVTLSADRLSSGDYYGAGWWDASIVGCPRQWRKPLFSSYCIWVEFWRKTVTLLTMRVVRRLGFHTCWRALVGKKRFRTLLNCHRFAVKEYKNERKSRRWDKQRQLLFTVNNQLSTIKTFVNFCQLYLFVQMPQGPTGTSQCRLYVIILLSEMCS